MKGGAPIEKILEDKRNEGWEGWKVPVSLLRSVIEQCTEQDQKHVVFAVEGDDNGKKRPKGGRLTILGITMDRAERDSYLKANPHPFPEDPPGQIDQFPPW